MMAREEGGAASGGSSGSHTSAEATEAGGSAASEEAGSAAAETSGSGGGGGEDGIAEQLAVLRQEAPIWQQPPVLELFAAERGAAKALAKQLAGELQQLAAAAAQ